MVEGLLKNILIEQELHAEFCFAFRTTVDCAPDGEKKGEESDFGHGVLAENHSLTNIHPEVCVDERVCRGVHLLVSNDNRECFFQKVAKGVTSKMTIN